MKNELPYSSTMRVRYRDTDAQGHLYFANYLVFADEVTAHYMDELGYSLVSPKDAPTLIFTVNCNCDFLGECKYGDVLEVSVGYAELGRSSARVAYEICNKASSAILAQGSFTQVFVDHDTRRSCAIPAELREAVQLRQPELA